jgi:hypothetical protein
MTVTIATGTDNAVAGVQDGATVLIGASAPRDSRWSSSTP